VPSSRPELAGLTLAGKPDPWEALGFAITDGAIHVDGIRLEFGPEGAGIAGWSLTNTDCTDLDGLKTTPVEEERQGSAEHPNGVTAIDHVVAVTDDLDRTVGALKDAGLDHRRTRDAGDDYRQAFFVMGPCLLELGGDHDPPVRFWGMTFVVEDIDAFAERYADALGDVKDAVQPGRRIVTVRRQAGLGFPVALITPR
jgi:hypothetical protein